MNVYYINKFKQQLRWFLNVTLSFYALKCTRGCTGYTYILLLQFRTHTHTHKFNYTTYLHPPWTVFARLCLQPAPYACMGAQLLASSRPRLLPTSACFTRTSSSRFLYLLPLVSSLPPYILCSTHHLHPQKMNPPLPVLHNNKSAHKTTVACLHGFMQR